MKIRNKQSGVALVVTLLMLSVITFLTVAFLAVSRRDRASVAVSVTQKESRSMSDMALARAQSEIIVRMLGTLNSSNQPDILNFDMMVSRNYINGNGFVSDSTDLTNVSYTYKNGTLLNNPKDIVQNIANLYYDPCPPVFIKTNSDTTKLDFRFYVDLNRNGRFESNGVNLYVGEPEWIGVLRNPEQRHSAANPFVGRYAYLVQPIGKMLDMNYIHNYSKTNMINGDCFMRNQGFGSWEINLAALLREVNPYSYISYANQAYSYSPGNLFANSGDCFDDALLLLKGRYGFNFTNLFNVVSTLGAYNADLFLRDGIDGYGTGQKTTGPFDFTSLNDPDMLMANLPWAGSDNPTNFYNLQSELFDTTRFPDFASRMMAASTIDGYTLQRLLSSIGTGSEPELQVELPLPDGTWERHTKININYDNTYEITKALNHATTNYQNWTALSFFTNAADLILRLQFTNDPNRRITNLCIYNPTDGSLVYDEVVHRCLQLAANIYDASQPGTNANPPSAFSYPSVFRPLFSQNADSSVFIVGYREVGGTMDGTNAFNNAWVNGFKELVGTNILETDNVWGIPWVVGARKGLPNFNELSLSNSLGISRKIQFTKNSAVNHPTGTNQVMLFSLTNSVAVELWNSYATPFAREVQIIVTNWGRISFANEWGGGTNVNYGASSSNSISSSTWLGYVDKSNNSFKIPFQTNRAILPDFTQFFEQPALTGGRFHQTNDGYLTVSDCSGFPVHNWTLNMTNNLACVMLDKATGRVLDFVNLGNRGVSSNLDAWLQAYNMDSYGIQLPNNPFLTNGANNTLNSPPSKGVLNQIDVCWNRLGIPTKYLKPSPYDFAEFLSLSNWWFSTTELSPKAAWFQPAALLSYNISYQANDPLVHYTYGDLEDPQPPNWKASLGAKNLRYQPWVKNASAAFSNNMTLKDPNITRSDDWNFPTNKFPNVGWLGRVHRGTPWQTIFLKSDGVTVTNRMANRALWTNRWAKTISTYPTNDWALVDLFTVAPNDNASRGTLSVNQTNLAPWSAVFSGALALTDQNTGVIIHPTNVPAIFDGTGINYGINAVRNQKPNRLFHHIGEILEAPSLTIGSPFAGTPVTNTNITDAVVESIPQRTMSLLRVGQPRFVIWAYGQSIKPAAVNLSGGAYNNIATNYSIAGESLTRTVCRVERDSKNVPRIVVERFNIISGGD